MAQGDVTIFQQFLEDVGRKVHNLNADFVFLGLIDSVVTPGATSAVVRWGAGSTQDYVGNQATPIGGTYVSGGQYATNTYVEAAGTATFDGADIVAWTQNAGNPTNARWGILWNNTATNDEAVAFLDLGSAFDMTTGDLTITWNGSGIATMT